MEGNGARGHRALTKNGVRKAFAFAGALFVDGKRRAWNQTIATLKCLRD